MANEKIIYIYTGGHYVHKKFAESITKDYIKSSWKLPKDYDIYFTEAESFKPIILRMFGLINKQSKIISLFSDPRLFYFDSGIRFNIKKNKVERYPLIKRILFKFFLKKLDGAICVGKFEETLLKKHFDKPIKIVYPFISEKKYPILNRLNPSLKEKKILFVTTWGDHYCKGLDFVIDIFDELKKTIPEVNLYILGKVDIQKEWIKDGLFFEGYKKVEDYLKKSSLIIHFGRGESFGINILESLLAGVPAIVSKYTGAKEVIEKINPNFIVPLNKKKAIETIKKYFELNFNQKKEISLEGKKLASTFREKLQIKDFHKKFGELINEIG